MPRTSLPRLTPDKIRIGATVISALRAGLGAAALVAPRRSARILGMDPDSADSTAALGLFAGRDLVLGLIALDRLRAGYPSATLLRLNALCDGCDVFVMGRLVRSGTGTLGARVSVASAAAVTTAWLRMARDLQEA